MHYKPLFWGGFYRPETLSAILFYKSGVDFIRCTRCDYAYNSFGILEQAMDFLQKFSTTQPKLQEIILTYEK